MKDIVNSFLPNDQVSTKTGQGQTQDISRAADSLVAEFGKEAEGFEAEWDMLGGGTSEQQLRESEERFRDFARSSSDWFWETDERHRFKLVAGQSERFVGGGFDDVIGKTRWEVFGIDPDRDAHWRNLRDDMEAHRPFRRFQFHHDHADGFRSYRSVSGTPVFDDDGALRGYRGTSTDITEQMQAEQAVRESEQRFRDLAEGSIEGIVVHRNFKPLFVNERYAQTFGHSAEEILKMETILALYTPGERSRLERYNETRARGEPTPMRFEAEGLQKNGSVICLDTLVGIVEWDGEPATQVTVIDITERKRADEELKLRDRQLSEAQRIGHIGHWTWDMASDHFGASDEFRRIYGFDPGAPLTIEAVTEAFHEDDREQMRRDREG